MEIKKVICMEAGTCCHRAVNYWLDSLQSIRPELVHETTFDLCLLMAKSEKNSAVFLPHLHPICGDTTVDPNWLLLNNEVFMLKNPPLHLAGPSIPIETCASLPRLRPLVSDNVNEFVDVSTTQEAARYLADGKTTHCITNESGLIRYGLSSVRELKEMYVWWMPFTYIGSEN